MKQKPSFIIFEGLSLKQIKNFFEGGGESPTLIYKLIHKRSCLHIKCMN